MPPIMPRIEEPLNEKSRRAEKYLKFFELSADQLKTCLSAFLDEIQRGLTMHHKHPDVWRPEMSSLMMLDCCIDFVPTGKEKGIFYAVDFGGSNMRAIRVSLDGAGNATMRSLKHCIRTQRLSQDLPLGLLDKKATASMLFDEIASTVQSLVQSENDSRLKDIGVGFTFSFGLAQKALNSAILTGWTKGFETGTASQDPVVGRDVCMLLDMALERKKVSAKVVAALNDTVGCMLSGSYSKPKHLPPCSVGIILGTGVNGAYCQPNAKEYGYQGVVMNTELGGFNRHLPRTDIDLEIDLLSPQFGRQAFEKMVSGMYIPEVCRLLVLRVFQHEAPELAWTPHSMTGAASAAVMNDTSSTLMATQSVLNDIWDWRSLSISDLMLVHKLFTSAFRRSAALASVAIAAMAESTGRLSPAMGGVTVGIDGTLYLHNESYRSMLRMSLDVVLGAETAKLCHLVIAEDGSGMGAAILAATVSNALKNRR